MPAWLQAHGPFPERAAAAVAYDTLKVISLCHDKAMVHGDVKPSNLMLLQVRFPFQPFWPQM